MELVGHHLGGDLRGVLPGLLSVFRRAMPEAVIAEQPGSRRLIQESIAVGVQQQVVAVLAAGRFTVGAVERIDEGLKIGRLIPVDISFDPGQHVGGEIEPGMFVIGQRASRRRGVRGVGLGKNPADK